MHLWTSQRMLMCITTIKLHKFQTASRFTITMRGIFGKNHWKERSSISSCSCIRSRLIFRSVQYCEEIKRALQFEWGAIRCELCYLCICICVFVFVYLYLCVCICVFVFVYLYLCICVFVYLYLYSYCCSLLSIISIGNCGTSYGAESSLEWRAGSGGESVPRQQNLWFLKEGKN